MTLDDLLTFTRNTLLRDHVVPPKWSDEVIVLYINEAAEMVARRTNSYTVADAEIDLVEGEEVCDLDPEIVYVSSIRLDGYSGKLAPSTEGWTPTDTARNRPTRYTLDYEINSIRFYPTPDTDYTAICRVAKLPPELTLNDLSSDLPFKRQYHLPLADWAAYRCFTNDDADGRNDMAAEKAKQRFDVATNQIKRDNYRLNTGHGARVRGQRVK